ncbi:hypothetical protein GCM10017083_13680 [Thalassobaculum fulvum]|jgi:CheY-like chemotaxis protein|uniref:Response regulatory domain-containing protein n=1 Tax=Thalassobaculum fulvum TaxID=1633335 RepID=A0A919CPX3_9PROT|nr:response regulator [Thalassobaculum fulvum]GHD45577.1 hypothetical protein GCM10017083_13680 [Thalassobaculum fulvum]
MGPRTALVADDCALTREVHADLLRSIGLAVTAVGSGNAAAEAVRRAIAAHRRVYDLTLLDFDMADGDGLSSARQIRSAQAGLWAAPLLCVTGHRLDRVEPACFAAGFDAVLSKPFRLETVARWLRNPAVG